MQKICKKKIEINHNQNKIITINMYVYFSSKKCVLTCEEYPQILSVENMKLNKLEHLCNRWEKIDNKNGTFTLSFKYNSQYPSMTIYNGATREASFNNGDILYLQNSGSIDIVCVKPIINEYCQLCLVDKYPNIYKWINNDDKLIFALHIKDDLLSDENVADEIDNIQENCHITFTDHI